jgi:hypothetical protein
MRKLLQIIFGKTLLGNLFPNSHVRKDYYFKWSEKRPIEAVIFLMDSRYQTMGFADCLRGMISSYAFAKVRQIPFKIDFRHPFNLTDYLVPNEYDWTIDKSEVSYNYKYSSPIWSMNHDNGKVFLLPFPRKRQYHLYTNVSNLDLINNNYHENYEYAKLYKELFRSSESLESRISEVVSKIGGDYISASFRFSTLLGDFEDCINSPLPEDEQHALIEKCKRKLEEIYTMSEVKSFFVTSDSEKFIEAVKDIDWITVIDGHRGRFSKTIEDDAHMLTFLDYSIISRAKKAYMLHTGKMYRSNFAKSAAMTTGIPYEEVGF